MKRHVEEYIIAVLITVRNIVKNLKLHALLNYDETLHHLMVLGIAVQFGSS